MTKTFSKHVAPSLGRRRLRGQGLKSMILAAASLCFGGCSTLSSIAGAPGSTDNAEVLRALGDHLDGCDRYYQGGFGLGASFTFTIDCKSAPPARQDE
jgi:hypothetical protein